MEGRKVSTSRVLRYFTRLYGACNDGVLETLHDGRISFIGFYTGCHSQRIFPRRVWVLQLDLSVIYIPLSDREAWKDWLFTYRNL